VVAEALLDVLDAAAVELQDEQQDASSELDEDAASELQQEVVCCLQEPMVVLAAAATAPGELSYHHPLMLFTIPLHILLPCRH
jgi:hypothetical protein